MNWLQGLLQQPPQWITSRMVQSDKLGDYVSTFSPLLLEGEWNYFIMWIEAKHEMISLIDYLQGVLQQPDQWDSSRMV